MHLTAEKRSCFSVRKSAVNRTVPFRVARNDKHTVSSGVTYDVPTTLSDENITETAKVEGARRIVSTINGTKQPTGVVIIDKMVTSCH